MIFKLYSLIKGYWALWGFAAPLMSPLTLKCGRVQALRFVFYKVELHPFSKEALAFCPQLEGSGFWARGLGFRVYGC